MNAVKDKDPVIEPGWHLDKKVPLSLIFAMVVQVIVVVWAIADVKKDVEVLKAALVIQYDRDSRQDTVNVASLNLVREDIREVKLMISRLIDRDYRLPK